MNFFNLPIEIGVIILNYLDTKSKISFYNSANVVRDYFATWCSLDKVSLSRNTLATVKTLDEQLFVDLGGRIKELNLSGVQDLTAENLKPHIHNFKALKTLDITFTNIYLPSIQDICPENVKNIGINFFKYPSDFKNVSINNKCKDVFRNRQFDSVHFVVFQSNISSRPLKFLQDLPPTKYLKIIVTDNYKDFLDLDPDEHQFTDTSYIDTNFNKLNYIFKNCAITHKLSNGLGGISKLKYDDLEYIFLMYMEGIVIYISPIFSKYFAVNGADLKVEVSSYLPLNFMLDGNIVFKAWNKASTNFDEAFFNKLLYELKDYFPTYVCLHKQTKLQIKKSPSMLYCFNETIISNQTKFQITNSPNTWFCIDNCDGFEKKISDLPEKITLTDYCRKSGRVMGFRRPIGLSKETAALKNLTFLRMNDIPIRHFFFTVLFEKCPKLITLDIYIEKFSTIRGYFQSLAKALESPVKIGLKNFMLTSEDIEYESVFEILSLFSSLENVHICEYERARANDEVDPTNIVSFIENCVDLYSLFIEADMPAESLTMLMAPLKEISQRSERSYLCVEVCETYCGYNPFVDVFNPSPLHVVC